MDKKIKGKQFHLPHNIEAELQGGKRTEIFGKKRKIPVCTSTAKTSVIQRPQGIRNTLVI